MTTSPTQAIDAQPHSGGWTESFWLPGTAPIDNWDNYAAFRARLLPKQAALIGYRQQIYTVNGNRLIPGGSASVKKIVPGNSGYDCDVPQMALEISGRAATLANTAKFTLRGIPDSQVTNGEFAPTPPFKTALGNFLANMASPPPYYFVGRDLTQIPQRIVSITGGVLKTQLALAGVVADQTWIRILKCKDDNGRAVKGTFLCTLVAAGNLYTLQGMSQEVTKGNGTARVDALTVIPYNKLSAGRVTVKKIGRPLQSYRGRASKRR